MSGGHSILDQLPAGMYMSPETTRQHGNTSFTVVLTTNARTHSWQIKMWWLAMFFSN